MYKHILISTDGSETARKGVDHGLSLARSLGARVTVVTVTEPLLLYAGAAGGGWVPTSDVIAGYESDQKAFAEGVLAGVKEAAAKMGVEADAIHVADQQPAAAIVDTAKAQGCSLIVMASHGRRGLGRLILGSQTSEVLTNSHVPVLVVR